MRIAIVSPYISTSKDLKYYQSQQLNLAIELVELGLHVDIITLKRNKDDVDRETLKEGLTIYRLPLFSQWIEKHLRQPLMKGLWKQLVRGDYDIIQSSEDCTLTTLYVALYALFTRTRFVIYQGIYTYSSRKIIKMIMQAYDLIAGPILRRACWIVVCKTRKACEYMLNKGFKKVRVIPVGVSTSLFYPEKVKKGENFELLTVGNLIPLKNFSLVLETFRLLSDINDHTRLTIIGEGPEKSRILKYVKENGLENKVRLLEKIPNNMMRRYCSKADLFLLFSKVEIFGMVILEAMACGCPVVSTPTPGAIDVIVDNVNGIIVKDENPYDIANRINLLLHDRKRLLKLRREAYKTVQERFSWPVIAREYYNIFCEP